MSLYDEDGIDGPWERRMARKERPRKIPMAETREFDWDEDLDEVFESCTPVERQEWRHGHKMALVFERDGAHWKVWICVHHSEGWERASTIRGTKVVPREKTITEWVPAPVEQMPGKPEGGG